MHIIVTMVTTLCVSLLYCTVTAHHTAMAQAYNLAMNLVVQFELKLHISDNILISPLA